MRLISYILGGFALLGCATFGTPQVKKKVCWLGDAKVVIQLENYGPGKVFVHVHANETTALEAARRIARSNGGKVVTLIHVKERDVHFHLNGRAYTFDPNRIYTRLGIQKTLKMHGCYDAKAAHVVANFAKKVLATIPSGKVVAVHNNKGYSLRAYLPHHLLAADCQKIYLKGRSNYRNFFLVTQRHDFYRFKTLGFNVVHQARHVCDDGSLSVALAQRHYVNVEAAFGELHQQMNMIAHA